MGLLSDLFGEAGEDFEDFVANPFFVTVRSEGKKTAAAYNLNGNGEAYEELFGLMMVAMLGAHRHHDDAIAEVTRELHLLRDLADGAPETPTVFGVPVQGLDDDGFLTLQVDSTAGRYAIFSDHHMLFNGNRQNFFAEGTSGNDGNRDLYVEVLERYYGPEGYTLVENGDLEELLIYEPVLSEIDNIGDWTLGRIKNYRESKKIPQLKSIVRDNLSYYQAIQNHFIKHKRYFRLTGNHDRDMRLRSFADAVSETAGIDMPLASDALILRGNVHVDFIICHGHQFDASCTPKYAAEVGESYSQAGGWAIQGPDRYWRLAFDPIDEWLTGARGFGNVLALDAPATQDGATVLGSVMTIEEIGLAIGSLLGGLHSPREWENLMNKNVAWNYFDNDDPQDAIDEEVKTGKRWFKFRHMNEQRIVDELRAAFAGTGRVPTLVLGHSHEPRFRAKHPKKSGDAAIADCYLNTASAGRFQNLIWGVELIDGEPFVISWHKGGVEVGNKPVRTIWHDTTEAGKAVLKPQSSATLDELLTVADTSRARMALYLAVEHVH